MAPEDNPDAFTDVFFSFEVFEDTLEYRGRKIYLPTDGDLFALLKEYRTEIPEVTEILTHTPELYPLWKTSAEFEYIFEKNKKVLQRADIFGRLENILRPVIREDFLNHIVIYRVKTKIISIDESDILLSFRDKVIPFTQAVPEAKTVKEITEGFHYVFIPVECKDKKNECIEAIRNTRSYQ